MKFLKALPFFLLIFSSFAEEKILFIGNSYTGGIRKAVTQMFKHEKTGATLQFINPGGKNLKFHVQNPATLEIIKNGNWDKIILQDQSQTPALPGYNKIFHQAADDFAKLFKSLKKKPQVYFYMTWGRRDGDKKNIKLFPDFNTMQKALTDNYAKAAQKIGATIVPVGPGFQEIHDSHKDLFKGLYAKDGSHLGPSGSYLAASIFYATLLKKDPMNISWTGNLEAKTAKVFKSVAQKVTK